ncbi:MAG: hypothetical protein ACFFBH_13070 [Promethearchaeota archaeon]
MLSYNDIKGMNGEEFNSYFKKVGIESILKPIMIKFPDYYTLRGRDIEDISKDEKKQFFKILKKELAIS